MAKTKSYPGSIYTPKGCNRLYIKFKQVRVATGLPDSKENRRLAEMMLMDMYRQHMGMMPILTHPRQVEPEKAPVKDERLRYADAITAYERHLESQDLQPRTRRDYLATVHAIASDPSGIVTAEDVEQRLVEWIRTNDHYAPASVNIHLRNFRVFINWLRKKKFIDEDIDVAQYRRKGDEKKVVVYTLDECERIAHHFATAVPDHITTMRPEQADRSVQVYRELGILFQFLVATGLRINEALRLEWDDVEKNVIVIPGKGSRQPQYFPITELVGSILVALRDLRGTRDTGVDATKVFRWAYSSASSVLRMLKEGMLAAGVTPKSGFHTLRKTFSDQLYLKKVDMSDRQKLLRHADIKTTIKSYTYTEADRLRDVLGAAQGTATAAPSEGEKAA